VDHLAWAGLGGGFPDTFLEHLRGVAVGELLTRFDHAGYRLRLAMHELLVGFFPANSNPLIIRSAAI
jgi:hypothetical protein